MQVWSTDFEARMTGFTDKYAYYRLETKERPFFLSWKNPKLVKTAEVVVLCGLLRVL